MNNQNERDVRPLPWPLALLRLLRYALHVLEGLFTIAVVFPRIGQATRLRLILRWARGILSIFRVRLDVRGEPPGETAKVILVANHVSWLDPALIMALRPAHFVAKSEIRAWPLLGWLAEQAGTIFIERGRRHDTARISRTLSAGLSAGDSIALFPEGTTTDGADVKPFHTSLFQAAVHSGASLYPVALRYHHADGSLDTAPAYTGDLSFKDSLWRVARRRELRATLAFAAPIPTEGRNRRELAAAAESAIRAALADAAARSAPGSSAHPPA